MNHHKFNRICTNIAWICVFLVILAALVWAAGWAGVLP